MNQMGGTSLFIGNENLGSPRDTLSGSTSKISEGTRHQIASQPWSM